MVTDHNIIVAIIGITVGMLITSNITTEIDKNNRDKIKIYSTSTGTCFGYHMYVIEIGKVYTSDKQIQSIPPADSEYKYKGQFNDTELESIRSIVNSNK